MAFLMDLSEWADDTGTAVSQCELTVVDYVPVSAPMEVGEVEETWVIHVQEDTMDEVRAVIADINQRLWQAREYQTRQVGERVYVETGIFTDDPQEIYRSEVLSGMIKYPAEAFKAAYADKGFELTLTIKRKNYWEKSYLEAIYLKNSNSGAGGTTAGLTVTAVGDGYHDTVQGLYRDAYAQIVGGSLLGDLPAPMRLEVASAATTGLAYDGLLVFERQLERAGVQWRYEMEDCAEGTQTPAVTADYSLYSDGYARSFALTGALALVATVELANTQRYIGDYMTLVLGFASGMDTDVVLQARLRVRGTTLYYYTGPEVYITDGRVQVLDTLRLPPQVIEVYATSAGQDLDIEIWGYRTDTGTALVMDYLYVMPSWAVREYRMLDDGTFAAGKTLMDDEGMTGNVLRYDTTDEGGAKTFDVVANGDVLMVVPQNASLQYLYFAAAGADAGYVENPLVIKAWYRPRKLAIL